MFNSTFFNETGISEAFGGAFLGGAVGTLVLVSILAIVLFLIAAYIYTSLAWYTIAKKLKYKNAWLAWIPIVNWSMMLQLGEFHWAWIFLVFVPIVGWIALIVLLVISTWRIFEARGFPGWFSLSMIIPKIGGILYLIAIGFVAWSKEGEVERIKGKGGAGKVSGDGRGIGGETVKKKRPDKENVVSKKVGKKGSN